MKNSKKTSLKLYFSWHQTMTFSHQTHVKQLIIHLINYAIL